MKQKIRIHYIQHVSFEGIGYIETWANSRQYTISHTKLYVNEPFPSLDEFDWLIVMGGPMGAYDDDKFLWMKNEIGFIKSVIDSGKFVLGICLGAQLIARVLGSNVYPNKCKEIGWFPVYKTENPVEESISQLINEPITVFHWHGDTFDLPVGAVHLLKSSACYNQSFICENVLALQFHLEVTPQSIDGMVENCRHELIPDKFIQSENQIKEQLQLCGATNKHLAELLNHFAEIEIAKN